MGFAGTNGGYDAFTDAGDDGFLTGAANQAFDVGTDSDAGLGAQLDAILGDSRDHGRFDDLGSNAHLHGLQHVAASKVDGGSLFKGHHNIGTLSGDERVDHAVHVAAGQVVRFELGQGHFQTCLASLDQGIYQTFGLNAAQAHTNERGDAHMHTGGHGGNPQTNRHEAQEHQHENQREDDCHKDANIRIHYDSSFYSTLRPGHARQRRFLTLPCAQPRGSLPHDPRAQGRFERCTRHRTPH